MGRGDRRKTQGKDADDSAGRMRSRVFLSLFPHNRFSGGFQIVNAGFRGAGVTVAYRATFVSQ